jgi:hypothetical protein
VVGKVAALAHELGDDTVEAGALHKGKLVDLQRLFGYIGFKTSLFWSNTNSVQT